MEENGVVVLANFIDLNKLIRDLFGVEKGVQSNGIYFDFFRDATYVVRPDAMCDSKTFSISWAKINCTASSPSGRRALKASPISTSVLL